MINTVARATKVRGSKKDQILQIRSDNLRLQVLGRFFNLLEKIGGFNKHFVGKCSEIYSFGRWTVESKEMFKINNRKRRPREGGFSLGGL